MAIMRDSLGLPPPELILEGIPNLLPSTNRSPGLHLTDIIHDLAVGLGHLSDNSVASQTRLQLGFCLERALKLRWSESCPGRYLDCGEILVPDLDGGELCPVTPDFADCVKRGPDEVKLTWLSSAHAIESDTYWRHKSQLLAQAFALDEALGVESDTMRLHVLNVNGDYRQNRDPVYRVWQWEIDRKMRENHWRMLMRHRREMIKSGIEPRKLTFTL